MSTQDLREKAARLDLSDEDRALADKMFDGIDKSTQLRKSRKIGETRGGARPGAGRPTLKGEKATEQVNFRLTPSEAEALLGAFGEDGDTLHKVCQRLARAALAEHSKDEAA